MKQQPDLFFRNKIEAFKKTPPADIWGKIESGLDRKKRKFYWRSIAASLLILTIAGIILLDSKRDEVHIAKRSDLNVVKKSLEGSPVQNQKEEFRAKAEPREDANHQNITENLSAKREATKLKKDFRRTAEPTVTPEPQIQVTENNEELELTSLLFDSTSENESPSVGQQLAYRSPSNITIVLTNEQTNEYLTDKGNTHATSNEKKSSTFKKLLKKASDLKSNQDPFGDLRQKKNEILALNFISDKNRGQKK